MYSSVDLLTRVGDLSSLRIDQSPLTNPCPYNRSSGGAVGSSNTALSRSPPTSVTRLFSFEPVLLDDAQGGTGPAVSIFTYRISDVSPLVVEQVVSVIRLPHPHGIAYVIDVTIHFAIELERSRFVRLLDRQADADGGIVEFERARSIDGAMARKNLRPIDQWTPMPRVLPGPDPISRKITAHILPSVTHRNPLSPTSILVTIGVVLVLFTTYPISKHLINYPSRRLRGRSPA